MTIKYTKSQKAYIAIVGEVPDTGPHVSDMDLMTNYTERLKDKGYFDEYSSDALEIAIRHIETIRTEIEKRMRPKVRRLQVPDQLRDLLVKYDGLLKREEETRGQLDNIRREISIAESEVASCTIELLMPDRTFAE